MKEDLKKIKKKYGEKMSHLCRDLFPTILENDGVLIKILLNHFNPTHSLYDDLKENNLINEFKNYIYNLYYHQKLELLDTNKTPKELLLEAGYILYECHTEEDIQKFRKYYQKNEELCTFHGGRLVTNYVFFAVKKDVDNIKRKDFLKPKRQDKYGTSVISIQFTRNENHTLSIKNRYNHTVQNPDATFSNNLENIIPGLTKSFEKTYGMVQKYPNFDFEIPNYVKVKNKHYKYNYEIYNNYYCPDNIIIYNFDVQKYDKEKYIIMDYFILDLVNKTIELADSNDYDSFYVELQNIEKINVVKIKTGKVINLTLKNKENVEIELDNDNVIVGYKNPNIRTIYNDFLYFNEKLRNLELPNVLKIENHFLEFNDSLTTLNLPKVEEIGSAFMNFNTTLKKLFLPKVQKINDRFLPSNQKLKTLDLPEVITIGYDFLRTNNEMKEFKADKLEIISNYFMLYNNSLKNLSLPSLKKIYNSFLFHNIVLKELIIPNIEIIGDDFLSTNKRIEVLDVPKLKTIGKNFLVCNEIKELKAPKLSDTEILKKQVLVKRS